MTLPAVHATGAEKAEMSTASPTPEIKALKKTFSRRRKRSEATVEHQTQPTDTSLPHVWVARSCLSALKSAPGYVSVLKVHKKLARNSNARWPGTALAEKVSSSPML